MADTTRDSFKETSRYVEVLFQRGKDVLDSELNEMQRIQRVDATKAARTASGDDFNCAGDGFHVFADGVTANQIEVTAGIGTFGGYAIELPSDFQITGLTTPGGERTDTVWVSITEAEVNSAADPDMAVAQLGETSVRKQLVVAFGVEEGSTTPPADSGGEPWEGGTRYFTLATLFRASGVAIVAIDRAVDRRRPDPIVRAAQDRNLVITLGNNGYIRNDIGNNQVHFRELHVQFPGGEDWSSVGNERTITGVSAGDAIGFSTTSRMRRVIQGAGLVSPNIDDTGATEGRSKIELIAFDPNAVPLDDDLVIIGRFDGTTLVLVSGVILLDGQAAKGFTEQQVLRGSREILHPIRVHGDGQGHPSSLFDHNGVLAGDMRVRTETWEYATITDDSRWNTDVNLGAVGRKRPEQTPISDGLSNFAAACTLSSINGHAKLFSDEFYKCNDAGLITIEFLVWCDNWDTNTNRIQFGLTTASGATDPYSGSVGALCFCNDGAANFRARSRDGGSAETTTGLVTPANNTPEYFRIELFGADRIGGPPGQLARFYQGRDPENSFIGEHTTNLPAGDAYANSLRAYMMNSDDAGAGVGSIGNLYTSMIRWAYRPFPPLGFAM